jgi:hypothetical protein
MCQCNHFGTKFTDRDFSQVGHSGGPLVATTVRSGRMGFAAPADGSYYCRARCPRCQGTCEKQAGSIHVHRCPTGHTY